jgi:hypothetical protein
MAKDDKTVTSDRQDGGAGSEVPYGVQEFAEKHGLSAKAAEVILMANGPSRSRCDAGARAFLAALAWRAEISRKR